MDKTSVTVIGIVIIVCTLLFIPMYECIDFETFCIRTDRISVYWVGGLILGAIVFLVGIIKRDEDHEQ